MMADVSFSVDIIMDLVQKSAGIQSKINNITKPIEKAVTSLPKTIVNSFKDVDSLLPKDFLNLDKVNFAKPISEFQALDKSIATVNERQRALMETGKMNNQLMQIYGRNSKEASGYVKQMQQRWKLTGKEIAIATKNTKAMSFDFLTLLFGGMALEKTFGGMYRSMQEGYRSVSDDNDSYIKGLGKLSNAFTYVKFSMFDAFANVLIDTGALDHIADFLVSIGDFAQEHPTVAAVIVGVAGGLSLLGKLAMGAGQVLQYKMMLAVVKGYADVKTAKLDETTKSIGLLQGKLAKGIGIAGGLVLTGLSIEEFIKSMKDQDLSGMVGSAVAGAVGVAASITAFFSGPAGLALFIAGSLLLAITKYKTEIVQAIKGKDLAMDFLESAYSSKVSRQGGVFVMDLPIGFNTKTEFLTSEIFKFEDALQYTKDSLADIDDESTFKLLQLEIRQTEEILKQLTRAGREFDPNFDRALADTRQLNEHLEAPKETVDEFASSISNQDILMGAEILKDINVNEFIENLNTIKTPLKEFIDSFSGEDGLIVSLTGLISQTQAYVAYLPTLKDAMTSEGNKVDSLTNKYNALARAKKKAREGVYDTTGTSTRDEEKSYTVYGGN